MGLGGSYSRFSVNDQNDANKLAHRYFARLVEFVGPKVGVTAVVSLAERAAGRWRLNVSFREGDATIYAGDPEGPGFAGRYFGFCFQGASADLDEMAERLARGLARAPLRPPEGMQSQEPSDATDPSEAGSVAYEVVATAAREARRERVSFSAHCDRACVFCNTNYQRERAPELPPWTVRQRRENAALLTAVKAEEFAEFKRSLSVWREEGVRVLDWGGPDVLNSEHFDEALDLAYAAGFRDMSIKTPGTRMAEAAFVESLYARGVREVLLTWHASSREGFARTNGHPDGLALTRAALSNAIAVGMRVFVHVPCVRTNVEEVPAVLEMLAGEDIATLSAFYWHPEAGYPDAYAHLPLSVEEAKTVWRRAAPLVPAGRVHVSGLPLCGIPQGLEDHFAWDLDGSHIRALERSHGGACDGCAARDVCTGLPSSYWGTHSVVPIADAEDSRLRWHRTRLAARGA